MTCNIIGSRTPLVVYIIYIFDVDILATRAYFTLRSLWFKCIIRPIGLRLTTTRVVWNTL